MSLILIYPTPDVVGSDTRLQQILARALAGEPVRVVRSLHALADVAGARVLFALSLGDVGVNLAYMSLLAYLRRTPRGLAGCVGGIVVDGHSPLYTKSAAAELALAANLAGCALVGQGLVEGAGALDNFRIQASNRSTDLLGAYCACVTELVARIVGYTPPRAAQPELLVLHASSHHTSNTLALWEQTKAKLRHGFTFTEIGLRNGTLFDCSGCPYTMCLHFGEQGGCFYGGVMQESVYPALRRCHGIVMLCPNYNDALSANLTAVINRLTAPFRQARFYDKALFAIVVSGYSGGDILARQLVAAMNMNKSFYLPPRFALLETANNPGEALSATGIQDRLADFAEELGQLLDPS